LCVIFCDSQLALALVVEATAAVELNFFVDSIVVAGCVAGTVVAVMIFLSTQWSWVVLPSLRLRSIGVIWASSLFSNSGWHLDSNARLKVAGCGSDGDEVGEAETPTSRPLSLEHSSAYILQ